MGTGHEEVSLLKLDCEGCEFNVLNRSGRGYRSVRALVGELHWPANLLSRDDVFRHETAGLFLSKEELHLDIALRTLRTLHATAAVKASATDTTLDEDAGCLTSVRCIRQVS